MCPGCSSATSPQQPAGPAAGREGRGLTGTGMWCGWRSTALASYTKLTLHGKSSMHLHESLCSWANTDQKSEGTTSPAPVATLKLLQTLITSPLLIWPVIYWRKTRSSFLVVTFLLGCSCHTSHLAPGDTAVDLLRSRQALHGWWVLERTRVCHCLVLTAVTSLVKVGAFVQACATPCMYQWTKPSVSLQARRPSHTWNLCYFRSR